MLAGMLDQVAKKLDERETKEAGIRPGKAVYRIPDIDDIIHLHSGSVLAKKKPEWVVYQEIYQTEKMYMRGTVLSRCILLYVVISMTINLY